MDGFAKICIAGHRLDDVVNCIKFYFNQIRGLDSVMGQIFGFPIGKSACR